MSTSEGIPERKRAFGKFSGLKWVERGERAYVSRFKH